MVISYGALAGLIAVGVFLILVIFMLPLLVKAAKAVKTADETIKTTNTAIETLTSDVDRLLEKTGILLDQTNALATDLDTKMKTLDPVVKAAADLGESVSAVNSSSKRFARRFSTSHVGRKGIASTVLASLFARHRRRRGED